MAFTSTGWTSCQAARQWLTAILQSIGDGVIATDAGMRITFMNPLPRR